MSQIQTILVIQSSPRGESSVSRKLTDQVLRELLAKNPGAKTVIRDLSVHPIPHLEGVTVGAAYTPPEVRTPEQKAAIALSDTLIDELLEADAVVIGVPMWNFGVPSVLKAWIDHVVRPNRTFSYATGAPVGLVQPEKRVIVIKTAGGRYASGPFAAMDHMEPYLKAVFGFIGVPEMHFVRAEGMSDPSEEAAALVNAQASIIHATSSVAEQVSA